MTVDRKLWKRLSKEDLRALHALVRHRNSNPDARGTPTEAGLMAQWNHGRKGHDDGTDLEGRHERLMDTLNGLRNGTLTKLEADEIQAAIEEALRVQRFSANH